jgi:hypothetical protein
MYENTEFKLVVRHSLFFYSGEFPPKIADSETPIYLYKAAIATFQNKKALLTYNVSKAFNLGVLNDFLLFYHLDHFNSYGVSYIHKINPFF